MIMRYGLFCRRPMTQREVAKELNISRSYVSRIEKAIEFCAASLGGQDF